MFSGHERWNIVHRPGTVQGIHRYQVLKTVWDEFLQPFFHSRGLELEHARGISTAIQLVGLFVIDRNLLDIELLSLRFLYV